MVKPNDPGVRASGGDHAITSNSTKSLTLQLEAETAVCLLDDWFDPIEAGLRGRVREFIQAMIEGELEAALSRPRYGRRPKAALENATPAPAKAGGPSGISGTGTDIGHARCSEHSAGWRSRCRAPGSILRRARQASGRARRCGLTNGEPSRPFG